MQDIEFTIERNKLYILQCRSGKRTGTAAVKTAVDMVNEGLITKEEAIARVNPDLLNQVLLPVIAPGTKYEVIAKGLPAGPGAASGIAVFDATRAASRWAREARASASSSSARTPRPTTSRGCSLAQGVLTERGGMTSHAALVARGFGIPTVAGCSSIRVDAEKRQFTIGDKTVKEGDSISLNGAAGEVIDGQVPVEDAKMSGDFGTFMGWADEYRTMGVRANADSPLGRSQSDRIGRGGRRPHPHRAHVLRGRAIARWS